VRLVADYDVTDVLIDAETDRVVNIRRGQYYTAFHFLPPTDGGFFGTGLGLLLGDVSDAVNTMLNIITDSAHLQSLGGGFLGREFRTRGGDVRFRPGEYKTMNAAGNDIRSAVVQLDMPGPSPVLFQVLGLLIEAGREIASVKDIMTGDSGGRAQTATTTLALIEQGMMVFSAAYRRVFRALKREFEMLARLNAVHLSAERLSKFHDAGEPVDPAQEYDLGGMDVAPVADPRAVTKMQEMARAQLVMDMANGGMVDPAAAARRVLEAANIEDREELAPEPSPEQQQMQQIAMQEEMMARRVALATAEAELMLKQAEVRKTEAEIGETFAGAINDLADADQKAAGVGLAAQIETLRRLRDELRGMGGVGRVASAPDDGTNVRPAAPRSAPAGGMDADRLVERFAAAGGGAPGGAPVGGGPGPIGNGFGGGVE
jgi:chaperonin GroES